jgi:hypothetical protein
VGPLDVFYSLCNLFHHKLLSFPTGFSCEMNAGRRPLKFLQLLHLSLFMGLWYSVICASTRAKWVPLGKSHWFSSLSIWLLGKYL